jgi:hypothetical protein
MIHACSLATSSEITHLPPSPNFMLASTSNLDDFVFYSEDPEAEKAFQQQLKTHHDI